jgi:hypothetical protein
MLRTTSNRQQRAAQKNDASIPLEVNFVCAEFTPRLTISQWQGCSRRCRVARIVSSARARIAEGHEHHATCVGRCGCIDSRRGSTPLLDSIQSRSAQPGSRSICAIGHVSCERWDPNPYFISQRDLDHFAGHRLERPRRSRFFRQAAPAPRGPIAKPSDAASLPGSPHALRTRSRSATLVPSLNSLRLLCTTRHAAARIASSWLASQTELEDGSASSGA